MKREMLLTLLAALCGWLFLYGMALGQVTEQWRVDTPVLPGNISTYHTFDGQGNVYGVQRDYVSTPYWHYVWYIHKVSYDGVLEWSVTEDALDYRDFRGNQWRPISVDVAGNVYISGQAWMDTVIGGPKWPCVIKYDTDGNRLFMRVAEPYGYTGDSHTGIAEVIAWVADSLGNIFAVGSTTLPGSGVYKGYAMVLSPEAAKVADILYDGGDPNADLNWTSISNELRGPDMYGNFMYAFRQMIYVNDTTLEHTYHLAGFDRNAIVRWSEISAPNPTNAGHFEIANYVMTKRGNIYGRESSRQIDKYSSDFVLQWSKSYSTDTWVRAENSYDESVLIYEADSINPTACYNANGTLRWRIDTPPPATQATAFGPDHDIYTYVGYSTPATLMRIDYLTGDIIWQATVDLGPSYGGAGNRLSVNDDGSIIWAGTDRVVKFTQRKYLTIRDAHNDSLPNVEFDLIKVTNNPPWFDEDTLGSFTTSDDGQLEMTPVGLDSFLVNLFPTSDTILVGDSLKIAKHVQSIPAVKHPGLLGTMYSVHLDNGQFADNGQMYFDTLTTGDQDIILIHTELRYNLLVSVEWEASEEYLWGLEDNISRMSSFLYDVSDGQIRLDTVLIFDAKEQWTEADMRICADNTLRPYCDKEVAGIYQSSTDGWQIYMPRIWWSSSPTETRNHTDTENPLNLVANSTDYRTKTHEFGHYALGFYDEYLFWDVDSNKYVQNDNLRCLPTSYFRYGFMDWQYEDGGVMSSEMSNSFRYETASCRNTNQWGILNKSCWDHLESWVEAVPWGTDNLYVPILRPDAVDTLERVVTNPGVYFPGPNNDINNPDYNVGIMVHFPHSVTAQAVGYSNKHVTVHHSSGGDNAEISLWNDPRQGPPEEIIIQQGKSSDASGAWVLGVKDAKYEIMAYKGTSYGTITPTPALASSRQLTSGWLYGLAESGSPGVSKVGNSFSSNVTGDSITIELTEVSGYYPLILDATLYEQNVRLTVTTAQAFSSDPTVELLPSYGGNYSYSTSMTGGDYESSITDSTGTDGTIYLWAVDDSAKQYFVPSDYIYAMVNHTSSLIWFYGKGAQCEFKIDSANVAIGRAFILSSPYPVIRTGLNENAVQAGQVHSLALYPDNPLTGSNQVVIRYQDADLKLGDLYLGDEAALAVYHWVDPGTGWVLVGGVVDTVTNVIYASITEPGVYAAFTNNIITDVEDDGYGSILPYRFELSQNYPNPFNPVTTISYSLPVYCHVTVEVYNVVGQRVRTLVDREESAGLHTIIWDGKTVGGQDVSTGVYLYRFQAGDHIETKKMVLLK